MPYLGRQGQFGIRQRFQYLAGAGDTSVSGADANGITMTFSDGLYIDVFLNGVKLKAGEDYNTDTANTVAGISAMNSNDEVEVIAYDAFTVTDTVSASDGGTFSGTVTFNGDINVGDDLSLNSDSAILNFGADSDVTLTHVHNTGLTLNSTSKLTFGDTASFIQQSSDGVLTLDGEATIDMNASTAVTVSNDLKLNSDSAVLGFGADNDVTLTHVADTGLTLSAPSALAEFQIDGDDAGSGGGPRLIFNRTSDSPADDDYSGTIIWKTENDNNEQVKVAQISVQTTDVSDGTEDANFQIATVRNGTQTNGLFIEDGGVKIFGAGSEVARTIANNLLVGATSSGADGFTLASNTGVLTHARASSGAASMTIFKNGGSSVGEIRTSTTATQYLTSSDYRLKENVTSITDGIVRVKQLKPSRFNFIADKDTTLDGFLAHETQTVVPEAISATKDATRDIGTIKDADGNVIDTNVEESVKEDGQTWEKTATENVYQGIDQAKLVPLLTAALQEAITKIETLETKVTALESK